MWKGGGVKDPFQISDGFMSTATNNMNEERADAAPVIYIPRVQEQLTSNAAHRIYLGLMYVGSRGPSEEPVPGGCMHFR